MSVVGAGGHGSFTGWRTNTRSGGNGDCVEVTASDALVGLCDSKDPTGRARR